MVIFPIEYSYDKAFTEFVRLRIGVIEIKKLLHQLGQK